ncbi:MAG: hypothetical protein IJ060_04275 [Oscillospiraceae bacterium]|nr:hypothetical protein [Oscillospiraceae bacterium]
MKIKKLLAVLSAAMLSCCALGGTAFAEETEPVDYSQYQLGDITMDGKIDIEDAQLALQIYTDLLAQRDIFASGYITKERLALGDVDGIDEYICGTVSPVSIEDAYLILCYYSDRLCEKIPEIPMDEYSAHWNEYHFKQSAAS